MSERLPAIDRPPYRAGFLIIGLGYISFDGVARHGGIDMDPDVLSLLCDPYTHDPLQYVIEESGAMRKEALVNPRSGRKYPIEEGIPIFVTGQELTGLNRKYRGFYDRFAPYYDAFVKLYFGYKSGSEKKARMEFLKMLEVESGDRVLEVSIGTGSNIRYLPAPCKVFGLDISPGMLKRCRRNLKKWGLHAALFLGNAERLPFIDNSFDVVFHVGAINFFNDKARAIEEMIRVAKPGTKILIADETDKAIKSVKKLPFGRRLVKDMEGLAYPPVDLVPKDMQDIRVDYTLSGVLYCLHFRKPAGNGE